MRTILGIDPGLATTGFGIIQITGGNRRHIAHGTIKTPAGQAKGVRYCLIYDALEDILEKYSPDEAGIETLYFSRNVKTALPVAEARGTIILCLTRHRVDFFEYTPLQVKQAVVGKGSAGKHQIQEMVRLIFQLDSLPKPDDAADALATALCHYHYSYREKLIEAGRDA